MYHFVTLPRVLTFMIIVFAVMAGAKANNDVGAIVGLTVGVVLTSVFIFGSLALLKWRMPWSDGLLGGSVWGILYLGLVFLFWFFAYWLTTFLLRCW